MSVPGPGPLVFVWLLVIRRGIGLGLGRGRGASIPPVEVEFVSLLIVRLDEGTVTGPATGPGPVTCLLKFDIGLVIGFVESVCRSLLQLAICKLARHEWLPWQEFPSSLTVGPVLLPGSWHEFASSSIVKPLLLPVVMLLSKLLFGMEFELLGGPVLEGQFVAAPGPGPESETGESSESET
jgi:hypothetical protein